MSLISRPAVHTSPAPSIRRRTTRLTALGASCVLSLGLLAMPTTAAADTAPSTTHGPVGGVPPLVPTSPAPPRTPVQQAMIDAIAKAKSAGQPVVVDAMTDEASKTVANPNGTLTTTDNAQPVRTKRDKGWTDLDATLRSNPDGSIGPAVASIPVAFSGGGGGPMATISTTDGKTLSVGAPFALPKPTLNGATATYPNVLPEVDLQLTALPVGGWRDVIVVHTPQAAASPALKNLRFPITAQGLTVASDEHGRIDVKDDSGAVRFRSPAPLQWDSSRSTSGSVPAAPKGAKLAAPAAAPAADPQPTTGAPSTAEAPGDGANVALIGSKVSGGAIELTPDQNALGSGTGPWYLDPTLTSVTSATEGSVEVQENHPGAPNHNKKTNLSTGYCGYRSSDPSLDCNPLGRQRAYFQFKINPAISTKVPGAEYPPTVFTSTLYGDVTGASSPSTETELGVYWAPRGVGDDTTWDKQPCGTNGNVVMEGCSFVGSQSIKGIGQLAINVTDIMKQAASETWPTWTIAIAPRATEWEKLYRHAIASNPSVVTSYDITPTVWHPRTSPGPGFANTGTTAECNSGGAHPWDNPGWVGNNLNVYLTANSYSPAGQSLYTGYIMWDDNDPNFHLEQGSWGGSYNDPAGSVPVGSLSDGHQYGWLARATDTYLTSPNSAWCYFRVDRTNPRVSISSTDFPPSGTPNPTPAKYMNDRGDFTINAEDPAPGPGLQASGIACVRLSTDPTPVVGWQCKNGETWSPGDGPYKYQPRQWGTNTLYAQAMDIAGNYSQPAVYNFYVPWKPGTQPLFGDIDNDQKPDILTVDKNGDLRIIGGTVDPAGSLAAPAASAPGRRDFNTTWSDFQLSHHGALTTEQAVDQIIAHYAKDTTTQLKDVLYLVHNDGTGHFDQDAVTKLNRPTTCSTYATATGCPNYTSAGWSNIAQVVAIGSPEGEAIGGGSPDPNHKIMMSQTSILTLEKDDATKGPSLYLFQPNAPSNNLKDTATLIPTLSGSWADYEILNPGAANGTTTSPKAGSSPVNQTTIWARHRTNGNIYAYALGWNADGTVDYSTLTHPDTGFLILSGADWTTAAQPRVGAADLNNDGLPDVWAIDNNNAITVYPGKSKTGTANKVDGFDPMQLLGYADAGVSIRSNSTGLCADAENGPRNGADVAVYGCWPTANQRFNFVSDGTVRAGGYCLSTKDNALADGTRVILSDCDDKTGQKWNVRPDGRIYLPATVDAATSPAGKCLELPGWATAQGTRLGIYSCPGLQANQQWTLYPERTP
ncbi:RICIN domain-containing protein [Kitasatospora sp. MAA19]|uniref:RICIN domain-containing protein n=1 Tax=Kitasatospora sp. MAA19 TaxID=3035090 RepID=UPI0024737D15|nr:RICIN domain-containing protein [Kitasatospora sp. MAA19]